MQVQRETVLFCHQIRQWVGEDQSHHLSDLKLNVSKVIEEYSFFSPPTVAYQRPVWCADIWWFVLLLGLRLLNLCLLLQWHGLLHRDSACDSSHRLTGIWGFSHIQATVYLSHSLGLFLSVWDVCMTVGIQVSSIGLWHIQSAMCSAHDVSWHRFSCNSSNSVEGAWGYQVKDVIL